MSTADAGSSDREGRQPGGLLCRGLGLLSFGLGLAAFTSPRKVAELCGVDDSEAAQNVLALTGVRELTHAAGLLASPQPCPWAWTRVAGDVLDLSALGLAVATREGGRRRRATLATAAVAGITAVDLIAALRSRDPGSGRRSVRFAAAVTVNRPTPETYRFWRDLENLPRFMYHLESVETGRDGRSHWTARGPAGRRISWDAELTVDDPNQLLAWRSLPGARVPNAGRVRFAPAAGGRGTEVRVELEYRPPAGSVGRTVARLFGEEPRQQVNDDLRRFKQVMETGEVVRSDGSPDGVGLRQQVMQRPARPVDGRALARAGSMTGRRPAGS